jgi:hypothetical protein
MDPDMLQPTIHFEDDVPKRAKAVPSTVAARSVAASSFAHTIALHAAKSKGLDKEAEFARNQS